MTQVVALVLLMAGVRCAAGLRIKECSQAGWVEIREDIKGPSSITCEGIPAKSGVIWTLTGSGTATAYQCGLLNQPCNNHTDVNVTVTRDGMNISSVLTIERNLRVLVGSGKITCKALGGAETSCQANVVHSGTLYECGDNFNYDLQNWTVSASGCRFDRAYSSNSTYTITWYRQREGSSSREYITSVDVVKTENVINELVYYSGTYSLPTTPLPTERGVYHYSVRFLPGSDIQNMTTISIERPPESMNASTTCPQYVYEGRDVRCECKATMGNPPPAVQWRGSGPDEDLVIQAVSRNDSGQRFSCELIWGPPSDRFYRNTSYTLDVAYGPDSVAITDPDSVAIRDPQKSGKDTINLTCEATNVHPSADFSWTGVTCQAITVSTYISVCSFSPAHMEGGDLVTCTAWNSAFPDAVIRKATYNFASKGSDKGFPLEAVTGGVVAVVVIIAIIILIVVLVKRRRRRKLDSPVRDSVGVKDKTESDEFEEHINPVYGTEDAKEGFGKPTAAALRIPASPENTDDRITTAPGYVNVHQHIADNSLRDPSGQHEANGSQSPETLPVSSSSNRSPIPAAAIKISPEMDGLYTSVDETEADIPGRHEQARGRDNYTVVDPQAPEAAQPDSADAGEDAGGYAAIAFQSPEPPWTDSPGGKEDADDYADLATTAKSQTPPDVPQEYLYAVVNKSKTSGSQSGPGAILDPSGMERAHDAYAQVQKPKSSAKSPPDSRVKPQVHPKPVVKPKAESIAKENQSKSRQTDGDYEVVTPSGEEVTQTAGTDDDYNTLNFSPRATLPKGDDSDHSLYSHIAQM